MSTIARERQIHANLQIGRPDGVTWTDVSDYLVSATVELGDISGVGTGQSGVDGVVRRASFVLRNDRAGMAGDSFAPRDRNSAWNRFDVDGDGTPEYAPLLWPNREVVLRVAVTDPGVEPQASDWVTLFHGLLGDAIRTSGSTVTCDARDLAKRLQDTYILTPREYGSEAGTPAEDVIQQIIDDNLGPGEVTLYFPSGTASNPRPIAESPGFMVTPYVVEYMSVWDAIQQVVTQFGWFLGYRWHPNTGRMQLILMEPPRNKDATTADFYFSWEDDIYTQDLEITDRDIRNIVTVTFRNSATNDRESVTVQDDTSIATYGPRAMQIEEGDASLIDTPEEAERLANAALADLKDLTATTQLQMPLLPTLDVFSGIVITDPRVSSTEDFFGVEQVRHTLNFEARQFRTEAVAAGRVIGGHHRWLRMQTRPGSPGKPQDPKPPTLGRPGTPTGLTGYFSGVDAIFRWDRAFYKHWEQDKVEVYINGVLKRTTFTKANEFVYTLDMNRQDNGGTPAPQVEIRVYHVYTTGALSPPAIVSVSHPAPLAPTVMARSSSAQVHWAVISDPPVGWKDTIVEVGSFAQTLASLAGVVDAQDAGLADGQIATVSVRVRNVFNQMSQPGTAQTTVKYVDKLQFAQDIKPVVLVSTLPQLPNPEYPQGSVVFLTTDNKLYRSTGNSWTAEVPTTDLSGTITETQIANDAVTTPKLKAGSVTTDKLAAGAVTADKLAANSVTAGKIAAGAVKAEAIDAEAVGAEHIQSGVIESRHLKAGIIDTEHIRVGSPVDRATRKVNASRLPNALPQGGVLFHFDGSLQSTQGLRPLPGYVATLRPGEGRFGGAVAVEEGTENLLASKELVRAGNTVTLGEDEIGKYFIKADGSIGWAGLSFPQTSVQAGEYYTFSVEIMCDIPFTLYVDGNVSADNYTGNDAARESLTYYPTSYSTPGKWQRVVVTVKVKADAQNPRAHDTLAPNDPAVYGRKIYYRNWQLEQKPFATSFVDGTRGSGRLAYPITILDPSKGTISSWVYINTNVISTLVGSGRYFFWGNSAGNVAGLIGLYWYPPSQVIRYRISGNGVVTRDVNIPLPSTGWHLFTTTWGEGTMSLYVDGELVGSNVVDLPVSFAGSGLFVGGGIGLGPLNALFDELLILPYAASEEEIRAWYELQAPFYDPTPHIDADAQPIRAGRGAVVINEDGLRGYKDGQVTFEINTSGDAWFGGDVQARTFILPVRPA